MGRASILSGGVDTRWEERVAHELYPGFYRLKQNGKNPLGSNGLKGSFSDALEDLINAHETNRQTKSNLTTAENTLGLIKLVEEGFKTK